MIVIRTPGRLSLRLHPRALAVGTACLLLALALGVLAVGHGDYPMSPADVLRTLTGGGSPAEEFIVTELRLPRLVTGLAVGTALGLAGAVFQSLVRNPLGSPDMLGFTQGAATGALVVVAVGGSSAALAGSAALGGIVTGLLIYLVAWRRGVHGYRLVLVGIGMSAILTGVNGYLMTRVPLMSASRAMLWLTGSLDGRGWSDAAPLLAALAVLVPVLLACGPALRMTELGDDAASGLGVHVQRLRMLLLAGAVLLVALSAAAVGPVPFVALTAPHLARRLTRAPGVNLLPAAAMGALITVAADQVALRALPGQLPVGVVTGVIGGGYLVWLLATERRAGRL
ncbi:iron chelate uptake ABC transporter family permease subunit [Micromonospora sp. WMMD1082]|uniref:FecCD family ABC transporter permease n=1 Tax=Micromonospora sp. WMMD1082 TaxID=3016104 RepID=UPI002415F2F3|nr:iron chelate uptake ABC transporter family permease subunit [Micromonospora sp. WMMD1082]MDG4797783.1 iron chelate uptake ABC transporter family permease subunit [Micromonospora sp. WMMD1082]